VHGRERGRVSGGTAPPRAASRRSTRGGPGAAPCSSLYF
jgi:hypothetical protein